MSTNRKPYQNHGFQNQSCHAGMVPPYLNLERPAKPEAFITDPFMFDPVIQNRQAPVGSHEHAVDIFSTDYKYQPGTWNDDCHDDAEHVAFNLCEVMYKFKDFLPSGFAIVDDMLIFANSFILE